MESLYQILQVINETVVENQRFLAKETGISVGKVNSLVRWAREHHLIVMDLSGKKKRMALTEEGNAFLEAELRRRQGKKLFLKGGGEAVDTAAILAGSSTFSTSSALLPLEEGTIIERMLRVLEGAGIHRFVVVGGEDDLKQSLKSRGNIIWVEHPRRRWTGSMEALKLAAEYLPGGFFVLPEDLVFESRAVEALLEDPSSFSVLLSPLSAPTESMMAEVTGGGIFRISRDIRQLNHVDGELVGLAKISAPIFKRMLRYYSENQNPLLHYEYVMENLGRVYFFSAVTVDDLIWGRADSLENYQKLNHMIYPRIRRKEREMQRKLAVDTATTVLELPEEDIEDVFFAGGLTNTNYFVQAAGQKYVLRIPGRMTESMIDRVNEKRNAAIAADMGLNCNLIYCDAETGIKVSEYIDGAETMTPASIKLEANLKQAASLLSTLHHRETLFENDFNVFAETKRYLSLLADKKRLYSGFERIYPEGVERMKARLAVLDEQHRPCHNDLVAANLVKNKEDRMYLIDWEYSGNNDPMFDIAALFLENDFSKTDEDLFFSYYYPDTEVTKKERERILIYKIMQDVLWSVWTLVKEEKGDDFGSYGLDRFTRGERNFDLWESGLHDEREETQK